MEYSPTSNHNKELTLTVGEQVFIQEQEQSGTHFRGYVKSNPDMIGVFHSAYVKLEKTVERSSISASDMPDVVARTFNLEKNKKGMGMGVGMHGKGVMMGGIALPGLSSSSSNLPRVFPSTSSPSVSHVKAEEQGLLDYFSDDFLHSGNGNGNGSRKRETKQEEKDRDRQQRKSMLDISSVSNTKKKKMTSSHDLVAQLEELLEEWYKQAEECLVEGRLEAYISLQERIGLLLAYRRSLQKQQEEDHQQEDKDVQLERELRREVMEVLETSRRGQLGFTIPRNDAEDTPLFELLDMHKELSAVEGEKVLMRKLDERKQELALAGSTRREEEGQNQPLLVEEVYHLLLDVKALLLSVGESVQLDFSVWDSHTDETLYEPFRVLFNEQGMPLDLQLLGNLKGLFVDITPSDMKRPLYLVVRIYRLGGLLSSSSSSSSSKSKSTVKRDTNESELELKFKRPVGCSICPIDFTALVARSEEGLGELCPPTNSLVLYMSRDESDFGQLPALILGHGKGKGGRLLKTKKRDIAVVPKAHGIAVGLTLYAGRLGGCKPLLALREELTGRKLELCVSRKLFFDASLLRSYAQPRNDFYATLGSAQVFQERSKRSPKNVCLVLQVIDSSGRVVDDCIVSSSTSSSSTNSSTRESITKYKSTVYYHCNTPKWEETVRVNLGNADFTKCRLLCSLYHISSNTGNTNTSGEVDKPFGYAFLDLSRNGHMVADGEHSLDVYSPNTDANTNAITSTSTSTGTGTYTKDNLKGELRKDTILISTLSLSTGRSQHHAIQTILGWIENGESQPDKLEKALQTLLLTQADILAQHLHSLLDSLFLLLDTFRANKPTQMIVFKALLYSLDQLAFRGTRYQSLLDGYLHSSFAIASVYQPLVSLCTDITHSSLTKPKMLMAKMLPYVLQFVNKSFSLSSSGISSSRHAVEETQRFGLQLHEFVESLCNILQSTESGAVGCQAFLFRSIPSVFESLGEGLLPPHELGKAGLHFIQTIYSLESGTLVLDKLLCLKRVLEGVLYKQRESRELVQPLVVLIVGQHLSLSLTSSPLPSMDESFVAVAALKQLLSVNLDKAEGGGNLLPLLSPLIGLVGILQQAKLGKTRVVPVRSQTLHKLKLSEVDLLQEAFTCLLGLLYGLEEEEEDLIGKGNETELIGGLVDILRLSCTESEVLGYPDAWIVMVSFQYSFYSRMSALFLRLLGSSLSFDSSGTSERVVGGGDNGTTTKNDSTSSILSIVDDHVDHTNDTTNDITIDDTIDTTNATIHTTNDVTIDDTYDTTNDITIDDSNDTIDMTIHSTNDTTNVTTNDSSDMNTIDMTNKDKDMEIIPTNEQIGNTKLVLNVLDFMVDVVLGASNQIHHHSEQEGVFLTTNFMQVASDTLEQLSLLWSSCHHLHTFLCPHLLLETLPRLLLYDGSEVHALLFRNTSLMVYKDLLLVTPSQVERYTFDLLYRLSTNSDNSEHSENSENSEKVYRILTAFLSSQTNPPQTDFLAHLSRLYQLLSSLCTFPSTPPFETERTQICLQLLEYLEQTRQLSLPGELETYTRYAEVLVQLHEELGSYCEAGLVLCRLAGQLAWGEAQIKVLERAIAVFSRAEEWERVVGVLDMLRKGFERSFQYAKVAESLSEASACFTRIMAKERFFSVFFRVVFYTHGEEEREVVYKGGQLEKNIDFVGRIKEKWPNSFIQMSSDTPSLEELEEKKSIISVTTLVPSSFSALEPVENLGKQKKIGENDIPLNIANYLKWNNVQVFSYKKAVSRSSQDKSAAVNEFSQLWVLQTYIVVEESFPCFRRTLDVVRREERWISPIQAAVQTIRDRNDELMAKVERCRALSGDGEIGPLSMTLNGTIDAAVNGGTQKYIEAFLGEECERQEKGSQELKKVLVEQLHLLEQGLDVFGEICGSDLKGLYDHLMSNFKKMKVSTESIL